MQEETRVSHTEKKVNNLLKLYLGHPLSLVLLHPRCTHQDQSWQRPRSPDYYGGGSQNGRQYPQRLSPSMQGWCQYRGGYSPESYHHWNSSRDSRDSTGMGGKYRPAQYPNNSGYSQNQYGSSSDYRHRYSNLPGYYHPSPSQRYRPPANQHYPQKYPQDILTHSLSVHTPLALWKYWT